MVKEVLIWLIRRPIPVLSDRSRKHIPGTMFSTKGRNHRYKRHINIVLDCPWNQSAEVHTVSAISRPQEMQHSQACYGCSPGMIHVANVTCHEQLARCFGICPNSLTASYRTSKSVVVGGLRGGGV
ncbi:hypothetical protein J1614_009834 [Plenodomus biglobosus]|nr:hypothetical protein J1614_009834 [Plenodomus biglobosus]